MSRAKRPPPKMEAAVLLTSAPQYVGRIGRETAEVVAGVGVVRREGDSLPPTAHAHFQLPLAYLHLAERRQSLDISRRQCKGAPAWVAQEGRNTSLSHSLTRAGSSPRMPSTRQMCHSAEAQR